MSRKRRGPTVARQWDPLTQRTGLEGGSAFFEKYGQEPPDEVWGSDLFTCVVRYTRVNGEVLGRDELLWLSIHRRDRKPIRDWRHMQAIKNEVAGPERIAVEVYPAESNLVDTSNEYHLWVLPVGTELPFGFAAGGLTMTPEEVTVANDDDRDVGAGNAQQRAWQEGLSTGPARQDTRADREAAPR